MLSLRGGAPHIVGAPQIVRSKLKKTQLQEQDQHVGVLKSSVGRRAVVFARREQPQEILSFRTSSCSKSFPPQGDWTRGKSPALYKGLRRSFSREKTFDSLPGLSGENVSQPVYCASNFASSSSTSSSHEQVPQESSLYRRFVDYTIQQCSDHMILKPFPSKNDYRELIGKNGKGITRNSAFQSEKIRNLRAADINGGSVQVLNLVAFPSTAYHLPIFCADLITFAKKSVVVLDLSSPRYNSLNIPKEYKEKYVSPLYPYWKKYSELLPWGGEVTIEALQFFSPFVIWSRPINSESNDEIVFNAFKDYLHVWLEMVDKAEASKHVSEIYKNQAAQHRYMTWRSAKDPGRPLLTSLYGEAKCEKYMKEFLFADLEKMGTKSFLDYFPQFKDPSGSIQKQRSVPRKAFATRPWDESGNVILSASTLDDLFTRDVFLAAIHQEIILMQFSRGIVQRRADQLSTIPKFESQRLCICTRGVLTTMKQQMPDVD